MSAMSSVTDNYDKMKQITDAIVTLYSKEYVEISEVQDFSFSGR